MKKNPFALTTEEIDEALKSGTRSDDLRDYFGPDRYAELEELVRQTPARAVRGGPRVLILPGIMASTLGTPGRILDTVVWVNPVAIAAGRLTQLAITDDDVRHQALDVIPYFYYFLRRRLSNAGFQVEYHYYDWRLDLEALGAELAERLRAESEPVNLVAHSMGGLVARLALRDPAADANVHRLVMLGTPNAGSFNALQFFDGTHSTANTIERMDLRHDMRELSERVFNTLPAPYQLLPHVGKYNRPELFDAARWPGGYPRPAQQLLTRADVVSRLYPAPNPAKQFVIATEELDTTVGAELADGGITYTSAAAGDGTVPIDSAALAGVKLKLATADHQSLPNDRAVAETVIGVLNSAPDAWPDERPTRVRGGRVVARTRTVRGADLAPRAPFHGRTAEDLRDQFTAADHRELLDSIFGGPPRSAPPAAGAPVAPEGPPRLSGLTIGRRPRRRLEITIAHGNVLAAEARVAVVGVFQHVVAGGGAGSVNEALGGVVDEVLQRQMFDARAGQVFMLPVTNRRVGAEMILFAGLGTFDQLDENMQRFVAANVIRTLARCRIHEFATLVFGANTTVDFDRSVENLIRGFLEGLAEADPLQHFKRVVFCARNRDRYERMKELIVDRALRGLFGDTEVVLDELELEDDFVPPARGVGGRNPEPVPQTYLSVRGQTHSDRLELQYSVLSSAGKAAVLADVKNVPLDALNGLVRETGRQSFSVDSLGERLGKLVLPASIQALFSNPQFVETHLTIVNDSAASRIPWETLRVGPVVPALARGVSRRFATSGLSVAKWLDRRKDDAQLSILLVVNPTEDLDGAEQEGDAVMKLVQNPAVTVEQLRGKQATWQELKTRFGCGKYDVIHYAGHAHFDVQNPERSGIRAADKPLTGADLAELSVLPSLVFFNACESGRVRRNATEDATERLARTLSFAEAFLFNGVAQLIGTYWPVGDASATVFANSFYGELVPGRSVGEALLKARRAVKEQAKSKDWADYIHYGDPNFSLKLPT